MNVAAGTSLKGEKDASRLGRGEEVLMVQRNIFGVVHRESTSRSLLFAYNQ